MAAVVAIANNGAKVGAEGTAAVGDNTFLAVVDTVVVAIVGIQYCRWAAQIGQTVVKTVAGIAT